MNPNQGIATSFDLDNYYLRVIVRNPKLLLSGVIPPIQ